MRKRKIIAVVLACVMALTSAARVLAYEEPDAAVTESVELMETYGDWEYTILEDGTAEITGYSGSDTEMTIPSEIDEAAVTSIGEGAFMLSTSLTSVTIPDSVTTIGVGAFYGCTGLISINVNKNNASYCSINGNLFSKDKTILIQYAIGKTEAYIIPDSVTRIGEFAFDECLGLTNITIPDSVISIGKSAFSRCSGLTNITIPDSVISIGDWAFSWCSGLTSITIPDSVISIGKGAFSACSGLTSITIPNSVMSIGEGAFYGCTGLTSINVNKNNAIYCSINGNLFSKDKTILIRYVAGKTGTSYVIPDSVTSIGVGAFYGCSGLTSVTIPNSVKSIERSAFSYCSGLTSITIPDSVTKIGNSAFSCCSGLTSVIIPDSVISIGVDVFYGYYNVTIYGKLGSYAQNYANKNDITFVAISNPEFNDALIATIEGKSPVYSDEKITVPLAIGNTTGKNFMVDVYVASYKDGTMTGLSLKKAILNSDGGYNEDIIIDELAEKPDYIKIFAFNGTDGVSPLCNFAQSNIN